MSPYFLRELAVLFDHEADGTWDPYAWPPREAAGADFEEAQRLLSVARELSDLADLADPPRDDEA